MKNRLLVVVLAMVLVFSLAGCGKKDSLQGTKWTMTKGVSGGQEVGYDQLKAAMGEVTLEFKKDSEVVLSVKGEEKSSKYKVKDNKVTMGDSDKAELEGTIDGDKLSIDVEGVKMELTKNK